MLKCECDTEGADGISIRVQYTGTGLVGKRYGGVDGKGEMNTIRR
jgi:hypothetical protein